MLDKIFYCLSSIILYLLNMKNASKLTIGSIIAAVAIALLSCFAFLRLVVTQPETRIPVNPTEVEINTGSALRRSNDGDIVQIKSGNQIINAKVARSDGAQQQGLMNVTNMSANEGMIFVFDDLQPRTFWMKNTLISLDIIYLDENLRVVNLHENTATNQTTVVYPSQLPAAYVLEVNGGVANNLEMKIGDILSI